MDFDNKRVVITGAGSGIGKKTAEMFLEHGAKVMIVDLDEASIQKTAQQLNKNGELHAVSADVRDLHKMESVAETAIQKFGHVDIWLNNVGTGTFKKFVDTEKNDWDFDIGINLYSVLNGCKAIIPHFIERNKGKIVNSVSDAGRVGENYLSVYSAAKAGVIGFTKALAREVGKHNILVNCVSFGTTKTDKIKEIMMMGKPGTEEKMVKQYALRRLGEEEDAANALLLMSSDYVSWITGQTLSSSGGFSFVS